MPSSARFTNAGETEVAFTDAEGTVWHGVAYPFTRYNRVSGDAAAYVAGGGSIAAYVAPPVTAAQVKAEAQRRIIVITGATDLQFCILKQLNALMRGTELINKKASGEALTQGEEAEAALLQTLAAAIKAIRAASNVIEALNPIPQDYAADNRWPI